MDFQNAFFVILHMGPLYSFIGKVKGKVVPVLQLNARP
jgi:hypothetical protein